MSSSHPSPFQVAIIAAAFGLSATMLSSPLVAQAANPLQPRSTAPVTAPAAAPAKPAAEKPGTEKPAAAADKPKRERSAGQLANDDRMRKCGAEWRAGKEKLVTQGYNWIKFSTECRARLKAAGQ